MRLQDALDGFVRQLHADGRSRHTIMQYERHVLALGSWLAANGHDQDTASLTPDLIAQFIGTDGALSNRGGKKKASSTNTMRTSIRCFCRWLHQAAHVATDLARLLRQARCSPPPPRGLHADEQRRLLDAIKTANGAEAERDGMLIELLLGAGLRIGSAIALDIEDIDFAHQEVRLAATKNNRPTVAILPKSLTEKLRTFTGIRATGPLFLAAERRISIRHAQRRIACWLQKAGIAGRSAHSLRHAFATTLLAKTGDLRIVQTALNHSSIVATTVYAQADQRRLRSAIDA